MRGLIVAVLAAVCVAPAMAREFYFDPSGSESTTCSTQCDRTTPCKTLDWWQQNCATQYQTGGPHTLVIKDGDWDQTEIGSRSFNAWSEPNQCTDLQIGNDRSRLDATGAQATTALFYIPASTACDNCTLTSDTTPADIVSARNLMEADERVESVTLRWTGDKMAGVGIAIYDDDWTIDGIRIEAKYSGIMACSNSNMTVKRSEIVFEPWSCGAGIWSFKGANLLVEDTAVRNWKDDPWTHMAFNAEVNSSGGCTKGHPINMNSTAGAVVDGSLMRGGHYALGFTGKANQGRWAEDIVVKNSTIININTHTSTIESVRDSAGDSDPEALTIENTFILGTDPRGRCWDPDATYPEDTFTWKHCENDSDCTDQGASNVCRRNDGFCWQDNTTSSEGSPQTTCVNGGAGQTCGPTSDADTSFVDGFCGTSIGITSSTGGTSNLYMGNADNTCGGEVAGVCNSNHNVTCSTNAHCGTSSSTTDGRGGATVRGGRLFEGKNSGLMVIRNCTIAGFASGMTYLYKLANNAGSNSDTLGNYTATGCFQSTDGVSGGENTNTFGTTDTTPEKRCYPAGGASKENTCEGLTGDDECNVCTSSADCSSSRACVEICNFDGLIIANTIIHDMANGPGAGLLAIQRPTATWNVMDDLFVDYSILGQGKSGGTDRLNLDNSDYSTATHIWGGDGDHNSAFWTDEDVPGNISVCWNGNSPINEAKSDDWFKGQVGENCQVAETDASCTDGTYSTCPNGASGNVEIFRGSQWFGDYQCDNDANGATAGTGNLANTPTTGGCLFSPDADLDAAFVNYQNADLDPASSTAMMVDAGSELNTTWRSVGLCAATDFYGTTRSCVSPATTNCCDIGATEWDSAVPAVCGNSIIEAGETCDDGNTVSGDGCSSTCQTEDPPGADSGPGVKNGTLSDGEIATLFTYGTVFVVGIIAFVLLMKSLSK